MAGDRVVDVVRCTTAANLPPGSEVGRALPSSSGGSDLWCGRGPFLLPAVQFDACPTIGIESHWLASAGNEVAHVDDFLVSGTATPTPSIPAIGPPGLGLLGFGLVCAARRR